MTAAARNRRRQLGWTGLGRDPVSIMGELFHKCGSLCRRRAARGDDGTPYEKATELPDRV